MYIDKVELHNLKGIERFDINFPQGGQAGWHVILGDNGSGKSTVIRAIALGIVGPTDSQSLLRQNLIDWIRRGESSATIWLQVSFDRNFDKATGTGNSNRQLPFWAGISIQPMAVELETGDVVLDKDKIVIEPQYYDDPPGIPEVNVWSNFSGWFSAGFGPFRRFFGGDPETIRVHYSNPRAAAHLSMFGENVALGEALTWLRELHIKRLEKGKAEKLLLEQFVDFVNYSGLLSHGTIIKEINSNGIFFEDGNDTLIEVMGLSDGFRSMLSLIFELLRQLERTYGPTAVFRNHSKAPFVIDLPGVVLIDEVDVHLHPTWQTRIGEWFTEFFPKMQFIVTTHSPLICRGAAKGTIWKMPSPGVQGNVIQIEGAEKDKLIYGNILDAFETDEFGAGISRGVEGKAKQKRYYELAMKRRFDESMTDAEKKELLSLQILFQGNVED